jgi:tryptophan halogenase
MLNEELFMNITILGGGTAGLVTALIIKKTFPKYKITVIKSDAIGIIGVGEGSTHQWRTFTDYCGISTSELLKETEGTLKRSIQLENWNGDNKSYYHTGNDFFYEEYSSFANISDDLSFLKTMIAHDIKLEDPIVYTNLIVSRLGVMQGNQYHFNALKLNEFLQKVCRRNMIDFVEITIKDISLNNVGDIDYLIGEDDTHYSADFFIDSTGFKRFIVGKLGAKWISYKKYLPMNHALAFPTNDVGNLRSSTLYRALSSGWNWTIATQTRLGNGYTFCDDFISSTQAYDELQSLYTEEVKIFKDIKFEAGRIDQLWINNCLAVGLSGSFVEPLQASSIGNSILQAFGFVKMLPSWKTNRKISQRYNQEFAETFDNIVDFIQLHYFTKRSDSKFWKELSNIMVKTDFNQEHIETWKKTLPEKTYFSNRGVMFHDKEFASVMVGLEMFDRGYIKQQLLDTYSSEIIENNFKIYNDFLKFSKSQKFIEHKILLEKNNSL